MARPRLLDLFAGQGGAAAGYRKAGFDVIGVDIVDHHRRYPGPFVQHDALEYALWKGHLFDVIHASPPCQGYSRATAGNPGARAKHQRLIAQTPEVLSTVAPAAWVIENVEQARSEMHRPVMLCGNMFALAALDSDGEPLQLQRHRLFESDAELSAPSHPKHDASVQVAGVYGGSRRSPEPNATAAEDRFAARHERRGGYVPRSKRVQQQLLRIDWMTLRGMQESIPPVYAEHIGRQLLRAVRG